eukprot:6294117-Amphidinium_carterae.4
MTSSPQVQHVVLAQHRHRDFGGEPVGSECSTHIWWSHAPQESSLAPSWARVMRHLQQRGSSPDPKSGVVCSSPFLGRRNTPSGDT